MCPFEGNVFSFVMVYSKILIKRNLFDVCRKNEILERIKRNEKQGLFENYNALTKLIKKYWNFNFLYGSKFAKIYEKLIVLKKKIMSRIFVAKTPFFGVLKEKSHKNIELQQTPNKVLVPQIF